MFAEAEGVRSQSSMLGAGELEEPVTGHDYSLLERVV